MLYDIKFNNMILQYMQYIHTTYVMDSLLCDFLNTHSLQLQVEGMPKRIVETTAKDIHTRYR